MPCWWLDLAELQEKNVIQQVTTDPRRWAIYPWRAHLLLVMDIRKRTNSPSDGRRGFTSCNHRLNITQQHGAASVSTPSVRTWRWILKWLDPRLLIICCVFPLWSHFSLWSFRSRSHAPPPTPWLWLILTETFHPHFLIHSRGFFFSPPSLSTYMERSRFILQQVNRTFFVSCNIFKVIYMIRPSRLGSHKMDLEKK